VSLSAIIRWTDEVETVEIETDDISISVTLRIEDSVDVVSNASEGSINADFSHDGVACFDWSTILS